MRRLHHAQHRLRQEILLQNSVVIQARINHLLQTELLSIDAFCLACIVILTAAFLAEDFRMLQDLSFADNYNIT